MASATVRISSSAPARRGRPRPRFGRAASISLASCAEAPLRGPAPLRRIDNGVAVTVDRSEVGRIPRRAVQLAPDGMDVDGDDLLRRLVVPQAGQQLIDAYGARGALGEEEQQLELPPGQADGAAADEGVAPSAVDDELAHADALFVLVAALSGPAAQVRLHPGHEGARLERLRYVIVRAAVQAFDDLVGVAQRRDEDDRGQRFVADGGEQRQTVAIRQHAVEQDDVEGMAAGQGGSLLPRAHRLDGQTFRFQCIFDEPTSDGIIFDYEY